MSEQDKKIITLGVLRKFKDDYDTKITTPLKNNVKALEYVINNSNRLSYSGETITNSNSAVGDIRNIIVNGNTRYKKSNGTYTDTWESGVSLESVGEKEKNNNGKYPVEVVSCGKNLFSTELFEKISSNKECNLCSWNEDTGVLHLQWNGIVADSVLCVPKVKENTQYILSFKLKSTNNWVASGIKIEYTDGTANNSNYVLKTTNNYEVATVKSLAGKTVRRIYWHGNTVLDIKDFQLEESTIATNYEPYKEDKRTILLDNPLRKVGEVGDVLDLDNSQVIRKCKTITIDKNITNWTQGRIDSNSIVWYIILSDVKPSSPIICDKLKYDKTTWLNDTIGICNLDETKAFQIRVDKTISTVSALTTWLASNPVTIVYELATPTTERIEILPTDNPLTSYTPSTTLTTNNSVKGKISADIPTNVNAIIVNQASAIASLQDTVLQTQSALIENEYNNLI